MTLLEKVLAVLLLGACLVIGIEVAELKHQHAEKLKADAAAMVKAAPEVGATVGTPAPEPTVAKSASPANQAAVAKLKAADHGAKVTAHVAATAEIQDTIPVDDPYHRFHLDGAFLERHEAYHLDLVVVTSANGESHVARVDLQEVDPVTGLVIPNSSSSPKIVTDFQFVKEPPEAAPFFHPRAVAGFGVDGDGAQIGAGAELLNGEQFGGVLAHMNLSLLGTYNTSTKKVGGAAVLGFRPFDWNISFGPAYFFPGGVGAAATIELTR